MNDSLVFLTVDQVLEIHRRVIGEYGGDPSVRDRGLLESAVMMPSARFGGEFLHKTIPDMAAAYLFHICRNHAFVDGNKRTALASAEVFLLLNDMGIHVPDDELVELTLGVASGQTAKKEVEEFFRHKVTTDE